MDSQQTKILSAILIAGIILGLIIIIFIVFVINHQRRKAKLYKEKLVAEISTLERERKRMASDLHDDIGPTLSIIKLQATSFNCSTKEDRLLMAGIGKNLDKVISDIKQTSNNLRPRALDLKGLSVAIEEFVYNLSLVNTVQVSYKPPDAPFAIDKDKQIHIYRIIQEIVNNALKHSRATNINIALFPRDDKLNILVEDNGIGFNADATLNQSKGFGLYNIYSRAEYLEGDISLKTEEGSGSHYSIVIPLLKP